MQREIVIVGVTHRSAPVEVREQLAFSEDRIDTALRQLTGIGAVEEGVIVSTCNRVEVVASSSQGDEAVEHLTDFLVDGERLPKAQLTEHLSVYRNREAVRHLFRVAASLDSMVVGEPQILGQLKESYTRASTAGSVGLVLHRFFHKSFNVAKRVRSETGIASRAVSVSSAAVDLANKIFDRLEDKTAMLIGAGTMSELAARHLQAHGVRSLIVANRTFDRAVELARELHGTPVPFEELERYLELADVVIGSTAADQYVLTPTLVQHILRQRKYRPVFLIDMSVPRNFDPQINDLDNVYLYDIDDLGAVAHENIEERGKEAVKADIIIDEEVDGFSRWLASLDAVPTIVALRERFEAIRRVELEKTVVALRDLAPNEREALEAMTQAIINKILHAPIHHLKQHGQQREAMYVAAARQLFDIDEPEDKS